VGGAVDAARLVVPLSVVLGTIDQVLPVSVSYAMMRWVLGIFLTPGYRFDVKRVTDTVHTDGNKYGFVPTVTSLVKQTG
jgi:hypothetical protein